ncbi:pectinesterase inhibitor 7-like [Telopea speciosissima]|uniref:pectinesterase inhibitor 7-like n=1 Tax=Telopea speciosissima TaxID=54955 RepID=UPI001CC67AD5|nr:pectinesterase inhibitor 7-like [Telopea speciosissima]
MEGSATSVALLCLFLSISSYMKTCSGQGDDMEFIKTSCGVTLYPDLCFQTLSAYATSVHGSPRRLAQVALKVSLRSDRSSSDRVVSLSKENEMSPREAAAVADCVEMIGDSMDELQQSLKEMKHLSGPDFYQKLSNIQTWVSAALTNEDTCMDGFEGDAMNGNIKNIIRNCILNVAQLTSNALALINKLSSTQANEHQTDQQHP